MEYQTMKLHDNPEVFSELIAATATHIGLPQVYVEKDYWVTNVLRNLSRSQYCEDVVFKGGTSLSKAYQIIARFSEDIDLAIFSDGRTRSKQQRLVKRVEAVAAEGLMAIEDDRVRTSEKFRKTVHQYPVKGVEGDYGQASSDLVIEVNSYTNPDPVEEMELQSLIAEMLVQTDRTDLIELHDLQPFNILVLSVKRTLVEKILGVIKDSHREDPIDRLSNRIRHLYDVTLILQIPEHKAFLSSDGFKDLCTRCIEDEKLQFTDSAHFFDTPLSQAPIFEKFEEWRSKLEATYNGDFKGLVVGELPNMNVIEGALKLIHKNLVRQEL